LNSGRFILDLTEMCITVSASELWYKGVQERMHLNAVLS